MKVLTGDPFSLKHAAYEFLNPSQILACADLEMTIANMTEPHTFETQPQPPDLERTISKMTIDQSRHPTSAMTNMQEHVGAAARNSKAAIMKERCQSALRHKFGDVYSYLSKVRTSTAAAPGGSGGWMGGLGQLVVTRLGQ